MAGSGEDHINVIERKIIDALRAGDYDTLTGTGSAWASGNGVDVTVYGQFPTTTEVNYPCIILEEVANGNEQQMMGRRMTYGTSNPGTVAIGELYGVGFNVHIAVDRDSSITVNGEPYKERRLINYLMLNCANVLADCDFDANTEIVERHYSGFREMGYNPQLEIWAAVCSYIMIFKNVR